MPFTTSFAGIFGYGRPVVFIETSGLVTNGLVIQLDAFNVASYPGTGTSIFDITGGYTHTLSNSATYQSLYGVKTFDCTISNKTIVVNGTGPTLPTSGYTYVCWGRIITNSSTWRTLYRTQPNDHPLLVQISANNLGFYDNDTNSFIDSGYDITPIKDLWVQYTVVGDNSSSIFYINETQVGTAAKGAGGNAHWSWGGIAGQPFGYIANMFYYNRKLSLAEITQNYNFLLPRFPNIVTTGLLVNVQAGNASSYPGSGSTWTNLVDNATYTITSGTYNSSNGGSIVFNGTSTVVPIGNPLSSANSFTYEAWVFASSVVGIRNIISCPLNKLYVSDGTLYADASGNSISSPNFPTNVWKHVVFTINYDGGDITLYVNGTQVAATIGEAGTLESLLIGAVDIEGAPGDFWSGRIAQVRIYNVALSAEDVLTNFNATKGGYLVTTSNLVLYYDPTDTASYPGTGTTLTSLVGSGLNGTMTAITYTSPYFTFNGTTSQVSVADNAALEPGSGDWTVEVWIRYSVIAGRTRTYVSKTSNGGGSADWGYGFRTLAATSVTYFEVSSGVSGAGTATSPSTPVTTDVWYQIVGVWTNVASNSIALYQNGTLVGSNSHTFASVKNTTNPLYLGNYNGNEFAQQFAGDMGIVRIYNKALSAAEVQNNYDANKATYGL
jgi:hypothetical protein